MSAPRQFAVSMLQDILEKKIFISEAKAKLEADNEADNAFINMLLLTTLRHLVYLRLVLKEFVKKKLPPQSQAAEYILLLGAAEILYLRTPDYAVINSYVEIAKKKLDQYVAGFVNAVLRKIVAEQERLLSEDRGQFFPNDFRHLLKKSYGPKTLEKLEFSAAKEPLLDLTSKADPTELAAQLGATLLPLGSMRLANAGNITKLNGYTEGLWWVQDFAAALPVKLLDENLSGLRVLDLCAAPGGKTAQLLAKGAQVTAVDISFPRLKILKSNLARLKLPAPEQIICADAVDFLQNFDAAEKFDIVLLDAPCTSTGTLRRHPELVHIKSEADVERQTPIQRQLLELAGKALKPGGILLYCVCSLCKSEGENQMATFVPAHPEYEVISLKDKLPAELAELATPEGYLRIIPQHLESVGGTDGFFVAQLRKI